MGRELSRLPVARPAAEFLVETLADEVLVYDQTNHRAHCLTPAAALAWKLCDGGKVAPARVALVAAGYSDALESVLEQLVSAGLVVTPVLPKEKVNHSRRRMLGTTAVAAAVVVASPVIFSIVSPSVAEAASNCGKHTQACCAGNKCNAPLTCKGGVC